MEEKKVYKIGLLPLILLIIDIALIIVVIIMGFTIKNLKAEKNKEENKVEKDLDQVTTTISANNQNTTPSNSTNNYYTETNNGITTVYNGTTPANKIDNPKNNTVSNSTTPSNPSNPDYTSKIVENKSYIYDAQYTPNNVKANKYSTNDGTEYSISGIVVPYVNMDSSDGKTMNSEIETLYNSYVEEFKVCSQNQNSFIKVSYKTFITSNIHSILITVERGKENNKSEEYIAYNFDVISGTKLDYNQICYIAGVNNASETVTKGIGELSDLNRYRISVGRDHSQNEVDEMNSKLDNCQAQIYTYYQQDLLNNNLVYFLDNNLKLNIVLKVVLPDNNEGYNKISTF